MNETEDIYVMKTVNALYEKFVNSVARQNKSPHLDQPTRPVRILVVHEGLVGGARAWPVMGAPGGGGVLRRGFERALTSTY